MKNIIYIILSVILLTSCSKENYDGLDGLKNIEIYDEFWDHVNTHYIYFQEKNVDWDSIYNVYRSEMDESTTADELLTNIDLSLKELRDAHNYVTSPLRRTNRWDYRAGYEIHFDLDLVKQNYIEGQIEEELDVFTYGNIDEKTVYIHMSKMAHVFNLRKIWRDKINQNTNCLIIDLRNNSGGDSDPIPTIYGDFVTSKTFLGSYIEKSGPSHEDETEPIGIHAEPSTNFHFDGHIIVLINRSGYSATSYMAAMTKALPNATVVGQITGGGGGGNMAYELSNGWIIGVSVSDFLDTNNETIEFGVIPDIMIENTLIDMEQGKDSMLEKAIEIAKTK